jgi:hypothetical protein
VDPSPKSIAQDHAYQDGRKEQKAINPHRKSKNPHQFDWDVSGGCSSGFLFSSCVIAIVTAKAITIPARPAMKSRVKDGRGKDSMKNAPESVIYNAQSDPKR